MRYVDVKKELYELEWILLRRCGCDAFLEAGIILTE